MITIQTAVLKEALKKVGPAVDRRSIIKAFQSVRIRIAGSEFEMTAGASDGQTTFRATLEESAAQGVDICVEVDRLAPLVAVADDVVDMSMQKNGRVKFSTSSYNIAVPSLPGSVFPLVKVDGTPTVDVQVAGLSELVAGVMFAANPKDIREFCRGVWIESNGTEISATATNGNILATAQVPMAAPQFATLLSVAAAELLVALDPHRIEITAEHFSAFGENTDLVLKPMSFKPVNWRATLPDPKNTITFDSPSLREAVSMHRHYGDKIGAVRFISEGSDCTLEIVNPENDAKAELDAVLGDDNTIFNYAFSGPQLSQLLQRAPSEKVTFYWDAAKPRAFLVQNGNWRGVVSPLIV